MLNTIQKQNTHFSLGRGYGEVVRDNKDCITGKQKELLIQLIYQNCRDEERRELWISQLDELTKKEASDQIQSFIGSHI